MTTASGRIKLLQAAYDEIYENGYQGANTSRILKNAGMNKGSMYHYFKSKKDLALSVINENLKHRIETKYQPFTTYTKDVIPKIIALLENVDILNIKHGCPVNNLIQEMSPLDTDFAAPLASIYEYMENCMQKALENAVKNGELQDTTDTRKLAMFIIASMEGAMITAKKSNSDDHYIETISILTDYLKQLSLK